jgi:hypothetical protein
MCLDARGAAVGGWPAGDGVFDRYSLAGIAGVLLHG